MNKVKCNMLFCIESSITSESSVIDDCLVYVDKLMHKKKLKRNWKMMQQLTSFERNSLENGG